jgi:hypothetical protein
MSLRSVSILSAAFLLSFAISGCNKSADQQARDTAPDSSNSSGAQGNAKPGSSHDSGMQMPWTSKPIVVPAETSITVVLDETIGSKISTTGQTFAATVHAPIDVDGKVAIPKGARASGIVKDAKSAGRFKGGAVLSLTLTSVNVNGTDYEIQTSSPTRASKGKGKRTAALIGGGAGGGALIGDYSTRGNRSYF